MLKADQTNLLDLVVGDIHDYDYYVIAFSGGKDSTACILWLLEQGIDRTKVELWHHLIDGPDDHFMDWKVTMAYCKAFASALNLPIYFSWREGGYRAELLKNNSISKDIFFETPTGVDVYEVQRARPATRRKFPQTCMKMELRWCTSFLKIDVGRIAITHQERFKNKKLLFITGERAEESPKRALYQVFEIHKMDLRDGKRFKRHVDAFRPVHKWSTVEVWDIIKRWKINPHPCYKIGFGRCSCAGCIFGNKDQFASLKKASAGIFQGILDHEKEFRFAIHSKGKGKNAVPYYLDEYIDEGIPYQMKEKDIASINNVEYNEPIFLDEWVEPLGMKGDLRGPC
jgi:3'-phosphoadenosine 5'-phosphosulfate sulfotransferase (PAPS reductase)/FAD synthetase